MPEQDTTRIAILEVKVDGLSDRVNAIATVTTNNFNDLSTRTNQLRTDVAVLTKTVNNDVMHSLVRRRFWDALFISVIAGVVASVITLLPYILKLH